MVCGWKGKRRYGKVASHGPCVTNLCGLAIHESDDPDYASLGV